MADVKHYAANNQEGQAGVSPTFGIYGGRPFVNVHADQRTLHETEFAAFEAAVKQGHSATVMCSYNLLYGTYACANPFLLKSTLRGLWGFNGFVVSDYTSEEELILHGYAADGPDAVAKAISAYERGGAPWDGLVSRGMAVDFDWTTGSAPRYVEAFERAIAIRRGARR